MVRRTRRRLLSSTAAAAAVLAGCGGDDDGETTTSESTTTTTTTSTTTESTTTTTTTTAAAGGDPIGPGEAVLALPALSEWDPQSVAPIELSSFLLDFDQIDEYADQLHPSTLDTLDSFRESVTTTIEGLGTDDVSEILSAGGYGVLTGSFDVAAVSEGLSDASRRTYNGVDVFVPGGRASPIAVTESFLIQLPAQSPEEVQEAFVDAGLGAGPRYVDGSETFAGLVADLPTAGYSIYQTMTEPIPQEDAAPGNALFTGQTGLGGAFVFGDESVEMTLLFAFEEAGAASDADIEAFLGNGDPSRFATYDYEITRDGPRAVVTGTTPVDQFDLLQRGTPGDRATETPQVAFDFEYDEDAGEVTITHTGGDTVRAENLVVGVDRERADAQFSDEYDEVSAGDSVTVSVTPGATVQVLYVADGSSTTLAEFDVPG